jgi:prepilin-type N-terminal cleavage/methylation domain-containing protein
MLKNNKGFTMVELLVAIASFVIIISIAVGGFSGALRSQRQSIALLNANYNSSLVLEQMAREIRTGMNFCDQNPPCSPPLGGGQVLANQLYFTNAYGQNVVYRVNNSGIEKSIDGGTSFKKITADDVSVEYLNFILSGHGLSDGKQTRITILIGIKSKESSVSGSVVNLQTTVSPRVLDS